MNQCEDLQQAFFCVPDITGFTRLIASADIEFSNEIIPGLLRRLVDANILSMNVGEIEGDAIFFYRMGRLPAAFRVIRQCHSFFRTFKTYIAQYEKSHPAQFKKHLADGQLGLKIIIHYGCACTASIKGRTKLIGKDVIIAHRLLKNSIDATEYILFTEDYVRRIRRNHSGTMFGSEDARHGSETFEYLGEVKYNYFTPEEFGTDEDFPD